MSTEQATRPDVLGRFLASPLPIEEIGDWIEDWKPHVYFLEAAGLVKIGHSLHVAARALLIQKCSPVPVAFLLAIPGEFGVEGQLHRLFAEYREHGEWFRLPSHWPDLLVAWQESRWSA